MSIAAPLVGPSSLRDIVHPQFHQNNLTAEIYIKNDLGIKLDKDDQICRLSLTQAGCPLGPLHCPLRHTLPSVQNFQPPKPQSLHPRERTVCKHWLRGLCKKGDACEFLHEYNLRRMPECWWFAKYGYCSTGDECLYAHPKERRVECPDYNRGFCKLGECSSADLHALENMYGVLHVSFISRAFVLWDQSARVAIPSPDYHHQRHTKRRPTRLLLKVPPPGQYGRYGGEFDRSFQGGNANPGGFIRRNLDEVLCFKCGEKGHYANHCRNRNVPGNRGGQERFKKFGDDY
ncbi:mRNA 3'-end-processing protein YTH1 [Mycena venus]|uniref:mRNA 3'-end-processing protein n=1 Tax=Mycena venus TaxID=2733690 RepID=A0A8H7D5Z4_9AGAR|nr:mRNA 3'-end-processing protein YTH1 [Mycena venus]